MTKREIATKLYNIVTETQDGDMGWISVDEQLAFIEREVLVFADWLITEADDG